MSVKLVKDGEIGWSILRLELRLQHHCYMGRLDLANKHWFCVC